MKMKTEKTYAVVKMVGYEGHPVIMDDASIIMEGTKQECLERSNQPAEYFTTLFVLSMQEALNFCEMQNSSKSRYMATL